jgi:ATP-binding cassette, subfamily B, bacterial
MNTDRDRDLSITPHFRLQVRPESFAEENLVSIGTRLERAFGVFVSALASDAGSQPIEVRLDDVLVESDRAPIEAGGYIRPDTLQMAEVYRPDAPGVDLERNLFALLLARALGRSEPPSGLLAYGLIGVLVQRLGGRAGAAAERAQLVAGLQAKRLPSPRELIGHVGSDPGARLVATDFVRYLLDRFGVASLLTAISSPPSDDALRAAFGSSIQTLEKDWRRSLKLGSPSGITHFFRLVGPYLRPHRWHVAEIVLYLAFSVAFGIGMAKLQGTLLDTALIPRDRHALVVIISILAAAFVLVSLTSLRQNYLSASVSENVLREMRLRIFTLIQRLDSAFFQTTGTGDIMSRMTSDLASVDTALSNTAGMGLRMALMLVAATLTILFTDWKLALVVLIGSPVFIVMSRYLMPTVAQASRERQESLSVATTTLQENLGAQSVVKAFGLERHVTSGYRANLNEVFRSSLRLTYLSGIFGISASSIASAIQLIVLGLGGWLVVQGDLTAGTLIAFLALSGQVIGPMQSMSSVVQGFQQATGAMDRVDELLRATPAIADAPNATALSPLATQISLEHVTFGYDENQPILHDLTIDIPADSTVALVGPSGCGKSTVLNLLLRFYDPQIGAVSFDGVDLRSATLESLRSQIGVVLQDNLLFNMSIRENIRLGRLNASDEDVEQAARAAEIHDLILGMPEGYDTVVGERGSRLSGGQRQRVAIARAIIRNPSVLLLDEATSALDPATEAAINDTLERLSRGRTTVNVTHRLASIVNVDRIFVLDAGAVVEWGTHDELVQHGGLYSRLWQEQGGGVLQPGVQYVGVDPSRLQRVPLFSTLPPELLTSLAAALAVERYPAGQTIIHEGESGDTLYLIHRGQVEVFTGNAESRIAPLAVLRDGDYFGEMALLSDRPRTATVRARTPVQVYSLGRREFVDLLHAQPRLAEEVNHVVNQRYAELSFAS